MAVGSESDTTADISIDVEGGTAVGIESDTTADFGIAV